MTALMDFLSTRRLQLATDSWQHVSATVQAVLLATLLSVAIGVVVYRSRSGSAVATGLAATALTVPSFALLGLLIPVLGLGVLPTMTALVIYAVLPILRRPRGWRISARWRPHGGTSSASTRRCAKARRGGGSSTRRCGTVPISPGTTSR